MAATPPQFRGCLWWLLCKWWWWWWCEEGKETNEYECTTHNASFVAKTTAAITSNIRNNGIVVVVVVLRFVQVVVVVIFFFFFFVVCFIVVLTMLSYLINAPLSKDDFTFRMIATICCIFTDWNDMPPSRYTFFSAMTLCIGWYSTLRLPLFDSPWDSCRESITVVSRKNEKWRMGGRTKERRIMWCVYFYYVKAFSFLNILVHH